MVLQVVRMVVSTYQAASGAGAAAMRELEQQTHEVSSTCSLSSSWLPFLYWVLSFK